MIDKINGNILSRESVDFDDFMKFLKDNGIDTNKINIVEDSFTKEEFFIKDLLVDKETYANLSKDIDSLSISQAKEEILSLGDTIEEFNGYSLRGLCSLYMVLYKGMESKIEEEVLNKMNKINLIIDTILTEDVRNTEGFYKLTDEDFINDDVAWVKHQIFFLAGELAAIVHFLEKS